MAGFLMNDLPNIESTMGTFQKAVLLILALVGCFVCYYLYSAASPKPAPDPQAKNRNQLMTTEAEFRDKLTELNMRRDKVQRGIKKLTKLKSEAIQALRDQGIESGQDYLKSDNTDVKLAVRNLKEYSEKITKVENEVAYYDDAIKRIRVMLDRFERDRIGDSIKLSEDDAFELQKIILDLDERLELETDVLEDDELSKLLDDEMKQ